mmetsp:Transcript_15457/g.11247  ORF Transcript_15457/g.11247 Transcript_15457/m.11247 type:complete len:87 (+) Transcript_15457:1290-1550(+)
MKKNASQAMLNKKDQNNRDKGTAKPSLRGSELRGSEVESSNTMNADMLNKHNRHLSSNFIKVEPCDNDSSERKEKVSTDVHKIHSV